ncbi:WD40 repeat domain-containing protein [Microcoleus sp.]|uniref:WD40 repeat domain-containing protein n=1 Tax=Microcoleus sp. TaxID=44472 RepID=UPI00352594F5
MNLLKPEEQRKLKEILANSSQLRTADSRIDFIGASPLSSFLNLIASGSSDGTVKLWKRQDGSLITTLTSNNTSVHSVSFSPHLIHLSSVFEKRVARKLYEPYHQQS